MPKISLRLNDASIRNAINQLKSYEDSLPQKCDEIRKRVTAILTNMVKEGFNGVFFDGLVYEGWQVPSVDVFPEEGEKISVVVAKGKDAVFIEFGAGVYYNPSGASHPARGQGIVAIGSYGHGWGKRDVWGYYDENRELHLTHGTPASMPMFYAAKEIAKQIPDIVREVFQGGGSV